MKIEPHAIPRLAPGVRLNDKDQVPRLLLMPERILRLNGPSAEIVRLCDGSHTVEQIAEQIHSLYRATDPQRITNDLVDYLLLLRQERAIDF